MSAFLVKDIIPGNNIRNPVLLGNIDGELLFATAEDSGQATPKLWRTDGTEAGTVLVQDDFGISFPTSPRGPVTTSGNNFFFFLRPEFGTTFLYKTDGTAEGSFSIFGFDGRNAQSFGEVTDVNGTVFAAFGNVAEPRSFLQGNLLKFDPTTFDPITVKDNFANGSPANLTNIDGTLYFSAAENNSEGEIQDKELWKSDGTNAGTVEVKDINPGDGSSDPENLTDVKGTLYFTVDDGTNGRELWKSDGTEDGTVLVKDIISGSASSEPNNLTEVNGKLFFTADDSHNGTE
ncbi:MAG: ELWxxDGT repeat protein, partial [Cyanobacteria bacterium J06639_18]